MSDLDKLVQARVTTELYLMVRSVSRARGEDVSDFVRRSIRRELASLSYLTDYEKKALGIKQGELPK